MMSHSEGNTDNILDGDTVDKNTDFGSLLAEARKAKNYTIEEISGYLKIPAVTISALENNNKEALPAPTFTQGYIRVYAKFLEMSEDKVLDIYNRAVPHDDVSDLKPRSNLPGEASSQSPLIKTITVLLIIAGITAIAYGSFQYYQKKAGALESELGTRQQSFTGNSLDSPGENRISIKQNARLTDDDELIVEKSDPYGYVSDGAETGQDGNEQADSAETAVSAETAESIEVTPEEAESDAVIDNGGDTIEIISETGAWVEVRDANKSRLLYNMLPAGASRVLEGQAPFSISMGNAKTTRVLINGLEVDVTDYIRPNNTANFKISTQEQNIIFH
ncbi:MAG: helix-turn-helix domain-containing protein [Proteobacteria bacterium]|nr:helix-turn-helix domain-containing protein [Pseudomonadota bacterium]